MKLVIYPPVEAERFAKIQEAAGGNSVVNARDEPVAICEIADADAFFGKLTPVFLAAAKSLKWVQSPTAGLEHYMFPELVAHPCVLTNMRGLYSDVIADHVFGYILCFARNLHKYLRQQMNSHWEPIGGEVSRSTQAMGQSAVSGMDRAHLHVSDCTLGVVGFGNIGREIGKRGLAFGMRVLAVDPVAVESLPGIEGVWPMTKLDELLSQSDFVVIAAPHTPATVGMFRREQFQRMKRSGYLINIGRGVIVRLDDLCAALDAGEIAGAALDVFEIEPLPPHHPLWRMENVILTPHVAACSVHIAQRHLETLLENIRRYVAGQTLLNIASKTDWY